MKKKQKRMLAGSGIALFAGIIYFTPIHASAGNADNFYQTMYEQCSNMTLCEEGHLYCNETHHDNAATSADSSNMMQASSSTQNRNTQTYKTHQNCDNSQQGSHHGQGHHRNNHHS